MLTKSQQLQQIRSQSQQIAASIRTRFSLRWKYGKTSYLSLYNFISRQEEWSANCRNERKRTYILVIIETMDEEVKLEKVYNLRKERKAYNLWFSDNMKSNKMLG